RQKSNNRCRSQLWFNSEQNAGAADQQRGACGLHCNVRFRNVFHRGILRHLLLLLEVMDAVHNEEPAEQQASYEKRSSHDFLQVCFDSSSKVRVALAYASE